MDIASKGGNFLLNVGPTAEGLFPPACIERPYHHPARVRHRAERATRPMPEYTATAFRACKAHHLKQGFLKGTDEVTLAGAGLEGRAWRRTLLQEGIRVKGWVDVDPKKIGRTLHGAPFAAAGEVKKGDVAKMLVTVGTRGAREQVRCWANGAGLVEGNDYLCVT